VVLYLCQISGVLVCSLDRKRLVAEENDAVKNAVVSKVLKFDALNPHRR
jgi:hypothetical protein